MQVKELIELLQKCNPEDIVMWFGGRSYEAGVDDVAIGSGTNKGFVFLSDEEEPE